MELVKLVVILLESRFCFDLIIKSISSSKICPYLLTLNDVINNLCYVIMFVLTSVMVTLMIMFSKKHFIWISGAETFLKTFKLSMQLRALRGNVSNLVRPLI
jgi:hypothetical protein